MSHFNDYEGMATRPAFSEADIELLLAGGTPASRELAGLIPFIEHLKARGSVASEARISELAAASAEIVRSRQLPARGNELSRPTFGRLINRFASSLAALTLVLGMTGIAAASNGAVPGDPLYGLDRALENVGIGSGGAGERLDEATTLVSRGDPAQALVLAAEVVAEEGDDNSTAALLDAAGRLKELGDNSEDADLTKAEVADMLLWMATTTATGKDFGQGVASMAKKLGTKSDKPIPPGQAKPSKPEGAKGK